MQHRNLKQYKNASKCFDSRILATVFADMRTARNIAVMKKAYPKCGYRVGQKAA
jgi:hypothetical protein